MSESLLLRHPTWLSCRPKGAASPCVVIVSRERLERKRCSPPIPSVVRCAMRSFKNMFLHVPASSHGWGVRSQSCERRHASLFASKDS